MRLSAVNMKIAVAWDVTTCGLVDSCQHSGGNYCLDLQDAMTCTLVENYQHVSVCVSKRHVGLHKH
jgi:hypothetical protein